MGASKITSQIYDLVKNEDDGGEVSLFIVMDYESCDLRHILDESDTAPLTHEHAKKIFYSFLCGLNFIHSANIMHRDIKPSNLLV